MIGELPPDPPEHVILSALQWRQERERREHRAGPEQPKQGRKANGNGAVPLPELDAATFAGKLTQRQFLDSGSIFPLMNVALLGGDGGMGKSLLAVQLAVACNTGTQWLGMEVAQGPVVYFCAEDDEQEVGNRLNEICAAEHLDLADVHQLKILPMVGKDTVLAKEKDGQLVTTKVLDSLCANLEWHQPVLLILDNLADVFSGNENNRSLAKQFIGVLRGLCIRFDTTILLLGHPSLSGMASGSGMSGSTAWNNSVRVRLYLHKPKGDEVDDNERVLEIMKANYGPTGQRISIKWQNDRFVRIESKDPLAGIIPDDVDRVKEMFACGTYRTDPQATEWGGYAAARMLNWDIGRGIGPRERSAEQNHNRDKLKFWLAKLVKNKVLFVVQGLTAKREPTTFYATEEVVK